MAQDNLQDSGQRGDQGVYQPLYPGQLGRALSHPEMDYNLDLIGQIVKNYRVMGTNADGSINPTTDIEKVLKLYQVQLADTALINAGAEVGDIVWVPTDKVGDVTGPQGPQGYQGSQGYQGYQGYQGFQGAKGDQGYQGFQGAQGFTGIPGNQGFQGPKGDSTGSATTSDVTANVAAGAINIGDIVPSGTTIQGLVEQLLLTTYNPTFIAPTFSLTDNQPNLVEIGSVINVGLTFNFNRGSIKGDIVNGIWDANATQDFRAGASTSYVINGNTQLGNTYTVSNHTVFEGINQWSGTVTYGIGPQPLDSNGSNYNSPLAGDTSPFKSTSLEGVYPIFLGNGANGEDKRDLVSHSANNIECQQSYSETSTIRHRIAIPSDMIDSKTVSLQQFNTSNNQWGNLDSSEFTLSTTTRTVQGNSVEYKLYTKSSPIGGPANYRIVFS